MSPRAAARIDPLRRMFRLVDISLAVLDLTSDVLFAMFSRFDSACPLTEFARQSGTPLLFSYDDLRGARAPAVRGALTPAAALEALLNNSGFRAALDARGAVHIVRAQSDPNSEARELPAPRPLPSALALPSTDASSAADAATGPGTDETIVITGSNIRNAPPTGSHVLSFDRQRIEDSGRATIADLFQTLPQNFLGSQNEATQLNSLNSNNNVAFGSTIDLRGLGADATLTLLNGRRLAPAGFGNFVDVSAVPLVALDRVEVLADGASATYGADAVGGVVNLVLRRKYDGADTRIRYGSATTGQFENFGFSQVAGKAWEHGSVLGAYDYTERAALANADRDFARDTDLRPFGGGNFSSPNAVPGNIIRIGATPVTLAVPAGQDGTSLTAGDLLAGQTNFQNGNSNADLLPGQKQHSAFLSARFEPTLTIDLFADILASRREASSRDAQLGATLTIPETNAYRQLNGLFTGLGAIQMRYSFANDLGPIRYDTSAETLWASFGAGVNFGETWRSEASVTRAMHQDENDASNIFDSASISAPLASASLATAFNPFSDGGATPASVLSRLTLRQNTRNDSDLTTYAVKTDGALFETRGGVWRGAFGVERREETFSVRRLETAASGALFVSPVPRPGERATDAAFAELYAPLIGEDNAVPAIAQLALTASVRFERSSDYGETINPKIGLLWSPLRDFSVRGTYGTSFKAPQFRQTLSGIGGTYATLTPAQDPLADGGSTGALLLAGGNPDLKPETATNWTAGFTFTPGWRKGLRLDATYFDIDFKDRIGTPGSVLQAIAAPQNFAGLLIRDPTPQQLTSYLALPQTFTGVAPAEIELVFDSRLTNLAKLRVRGLDAALKYEWETDWGAFGADLGASLLFAYDRQANANSLSVDVVDTIFNPVDLRARVGLSWQAGAWRSALSANYVDDYRDTVSAPQRAIASWTTFDLRIAHSWDESAPPPLQGVQVALSALNFTDEDPPFVNASQGIGFDSSNAAPQGRVVGIEISRRW